MKKPQQPTRIGIEVGRLLLRNEQDYSDLRRKMNITNVELHLMLNHEGIPNPKDVDKLAKALNVSPTWLLLKSLPIEEELTPKEVEAFNRIPDRIESCYND